MAPRALVVSTLAMLATTVAAAALAYQYAPQYIKTRRRAEEAGSSSTQQAVACSLLDTDASGGARSPDEVLPQDGEVHERWRLVMFAGVSTLVAIALVSLAFVAMQDEEEKHGRRWGPKTLGIGVVVALIGLCALLADAVTPKTCGQDGFHRRRSSVVSCRVQKI